MFGSVFTVLLSGKSSSGPTLKSSLVDFGSDNDTTLRGIRRLILSSTYDVNGNLNAGNNRFTYSSLSFAQSADLSISSGRKFYSGVDVDCNGNLTVNPGCRYAPILAFAESADLFITLNKLSTAKTITFDMFESADFDLVGIRRTPASTSFEEITDVIISPVRLMSLPVAITTATDTSCTGYRYIVSSTVFDSSESFLITGYARLGVITVFDETTDVFVDIVKSAGSNLVPLSINTGSSADLAINNKRYLASSIDVNEISDFMVNDNIRSSLSIACGSSSDFYITLINANARQYTAIINFNMTVHEIGYFTMVNTPFVVEFAAPV